METEKHNEILKQILKTINNLQNIVQMDTLKSRGISKILKILQNVKALSYMIQIDISKSEILKSMTSELLVKPCDNEGS